jgi:hypothetical protein
MKNKGSSKALSSEGRRVRVFNLPATVRVVESRALEKK